MKKLIAAVILILMIGLNANADAPSIDYGSAPNMIEGHATAYVLTGKTASGKYTRHGIAAMHDREMLGKTAIVYQRLPDGSVGKQIGIYEIEDTGCASSVIDVWCDGMDEAHEFMKKVYRNQCHGKVWIQIVDAEG